MDRPNVSHLSANTKVTIIVTLLPSKEKVPARLPAKKTKEINKQYMTPLANSKWAILKSEVHTILATTSKIKCIVNLLKKMIRLLPHS